MKVMHLGFAALCLLAVACGGRTDQGEEETDGSDEAPAAPDGSDPGAEPGTPDEGVALPGCEKGFDRYKEPSRSCNWVAKGSCYEDKLEACACVCPRDTSAASHCSSGFPVEDGAVDVYCY